MRGLRVLWRQSPWQSWVVRLNRQRGAKDCIPQISIVPRGHDLVICCPERKVKNWRLSNDSQYTYQHLGQNKVVPHSFWKGGQVLNPHCKVEADFAGYYTKSHPSIQDPSDACWSVEQAKNVAECLRLAEASQGAAIREKDLEHGRDTANAAKLAYLSWQSSVRE